MAITTTTLRTLVAGHGKRFVGAAAALLAAAALQYSAPLIWQIVVDGVLADPDQAPAWVDRSVELFGGREHVRTHLWQPAALFVGITAAAGVFTWLRGRLAARASEDAIAELRRRLYDRLHHLPLAYYDRAETGDLVQRCTSDVDKVRTFLESQLPEIVHAWVMLIVALPVMAILDVRTTLVALALVPLVLGFSAGFFRRARERFADVDVAEGRLTAALQENLTGIRVVRAFARQRFEALRFARVNDGQRRATARLFDGLAWYWSSSDLLVLTQRGVLLAYGATRVAEGTLQVGALLYFITAAGMFIYPLRMMGRILADLGKTQVAIERLAAVLDEPVEGHADPVDEPRDRARGAIELTSLRFAHADGPPAVDSVSLEIPAGSSVAIVGASGAGKSTLVDLLLRLRDPQSGTIRIDGVDITRLPRKQVRRWVASVLQEPFLYSRSVADNLRFGRADADDGALEAAARVAAVHEAVAAMADGYATLVGERGVTLSGGQRQRLALARALLTEAPVLILDDALSAVDTQTEAAILDALAARRGRCTTLLIAHRLTTVALADRIVVLDRGRVVEQGSHAELLARGGVYARAWALQTELTVSKPAEGSRSSELRGEGAVS